MGIRKNAAHLTPTERDNFLRALLTLKKTIANPGDPPAQQISIYDQFVAIHLCIQSINVPGGGAPVNMGHGNSGFGPWHRYYLLLFERALQDAVMDPTITLPYWDWTDHTMTETIFFQANFMGPNGGIGGGTVQSGYLAFSAPGTGGNPTPLPAWWPAGLAGWRLRSDLGMFFGTTLQRFLDSFGNLAIQADIVGALSRPNYENVGPETEFRPALESNARMHNDTHNWFGGHMSQPNASPNDPVFFLHHCNVDRLWAMWQIDGHQGAAFYPAAGRPQGHNLNDPMWPWVGALPGYSSNNLPATVVLPDFSGAPIQHPVDVLDHRALGYAYDTEAIVGIALDQTGSMIGMTPDPMTGMAPNILKWDAAKQGVSFLLHDCETAYAAAEAYVTAGVETFRRLAANTFTSIFAPGTPYGLIKNGSSFSRATFDANIAAQSPDGGTPLAGALTDTDTSLVRAPFTDLPANEQRYLCILTDGKETALPLLITLAEPAFPDTVIFAMGFGVGGGWDGVDYTTITDLTEKGKAAPGVTQVFHGENAATIDKFYTNSIAAAIGYTPSSDPVFELFPGEFLHFPFDVTDAERALMVTALGFDFSDKNWDFCLMAPDGSHCGDTRADSHLARHRVHEPEGMHHEAFPYLITLKKKNGRCTIFLNRNGAASSHWVGRWYLMAFYKADPDNPIMVMPDVANMILPLGAPPVRGPLYARFDQKASQRPALRTIPGTPAHPFAFGLPGISSRKRGNPCALSINVFSKSTTRAELAVNLQAPYAGQDFEIALQLSDPTSSKLDQLRVAARLVAPQYVIGNAFADLETIPLKERKKYLNRKNPRAPFNEILYLADYERRKPGAFPIRDEEIIFTRGQDGVFRARVGNNLFPGIYRVAVYIEGTLDLGEKSRDEHCCKKGPQRFSRVLNTAVALGILPDAKASRPTLHWVAPDKFVVTVTPTDTLGNIAAPANAPVPVVAVNGKTVIGKPVNAYTGEHRVEIELLGEGFQPAPDGQTIAGAAASIQTESGERLILQPGEKIAPAISLARTAFQVVLPKFVGDKKSRIAYGAGTPEAMRIPLADRDVFQSREEAIAAGYEVH